MSSAKSTDFDQSAGTKSTMDAAECSDDESSESANTEDKVVPAPAPVIICIEDDSEVLTDEECSVRKSNLRSRDSLVNLNNKVNDDEVHAPNANLQDCLVPNHSFHINADETADPPKSMLMEKTKGILTSANGPQVEDKPKGKRAVSFSEVTVRDYGMILGDHPCCSYGPPVTLDWDYLEYNPLDVNDYEYHHPSRRSLREMGMSYYMRMDILTKAGHTDQDFVKSKKDIKQIKMNRTITKTAIVYNFNFVQDAIESAYRKIRRMSGKTDHWKCKDEKENIAKLRVQDSFRQEKMLSTSSRSSRSLCVE